MNTIDATLFTEVFNSTIVEISDTDRTVGTDPANTACKQTVGTDLENAAQENETVKLSTATIVQSPISSGKVLSAFRLADDKIGLVLSQRDAKFEAFKKAKDTAGLYASERLIKNRQELPS